MDEADSKNSSYRILTLDQADLGLQREYLIKGVEDKVYYVILVGAFLSHALKLEVCPFYSEIL